MRHLKKLLVFVIVFATLSLLSCEEEVKEFEYQKVDGGIEITKYNGTDTEINIPEEIDKKTVVSIGEGAFETLQVTKITVPKTVTTIKNYAFRQNIYLENVEILGEIKTIPSGLFNFCVSLTEFEIPSGVETIGENAFGGTGLKEVVLPDSVKTVGNFAFYSCVHLSSFKSGAGLQSLGESALGECISLADITLNEGLTTIGEACFSGCTSLKDISIPSTIETLESYVFAATALEEYHVPSSIETIRSYAFAGCKSLGDIYVPDTVTNIERDAFNEMKDFVIHGIPDSTAEIYADNNGLKFEKYSR